MDRRGFLGLLGMGVAGIALEQAIPFNRVWSFPKKIVIPDSRAKLGEVFMTRFPASYKIEIGDVVRFSDWPGLFVVSRVHNSEGKAELYSAEQRLLIRNVLQSRVSVPE